mmetsp:Transcript_14691/g.22761  ORF Transcript_14691/g.22761 Transcript_14691/m.22761 type:complete len:81 (+) Transcript_14691:754-996(+)
MGRRVRYIILHAYSILLIKVEGDDTQRGVSTTKASTVGKELASASLIIVPDADHVKASIWPGVSTNICLYDVLVSNICMT